MSSVPQTFVGGRPPIAILGVPFDNVTTAETLELVAEMVATGRPHYLVTANVDFVVQAQKDADFRRTLIEAHLVVADGMPLVWASRWLGNPLPERVTGSGMTPLLLAEAARRGWRVFFLGGAEDSLNRAVANTRKKHPELKLVGAYSPPFKPLGEMDHPEILRRIREARPEILLVAFGCPKQEKWLNQHYREAGVPVAIGVGATIDFLAGTVRRAPVWMQRSGLEWVFRLLQEPRRLFRRYGTDLWVFGWAILRQLKAMRAHRAQRLPAARPAAKGAAADTDLVLQLPARFDAAEVTANASAWSALHVAQGNLVLDGARVAFIDSTGVGCLLQLRKACQAQGRQILLMSASPALGRTLELMKLVEVLPQVPDFSAALRQLGDDRQKARVLCSMELGASARTLHWIGEITAANTAPIGRLTESVMTDRTTPLTLDLGRVGFIDSSGLGLLVSLRKAAGRKGIPLELSNSPPDLLALVRMLRLEKYLFGDS